MGKNRKKGIRRKQSKALQHVQNLQQQKQLKEEEENWFKNIKELDQITSIQINRVYKLLSRPCQKQKRGHKNCKENPNCLLGLGELSQDKRKNAALSQLGPDPSKLKREKGVFTGLKNLGATCYMNSLLQCLFMNTAFRQAIYDWKPSSLTKQPDAVYELQMLFARLQYGQLQYVDPSDFVNSVKLKPNVQQDPQEFFSLFLSLLESKFSTQENPEVRHLTQQQFEGKYKYITTCKSCKHTSISDDHSFNELQLTIKGHSTIQECLKELIAEEELTGANQYLCTACNSKQDAVHRLALSHLPQVLNFQLLRFVYDQKTGRKKKTRSRINFSQVLDMSPYMSAPTAPSASPQPSSPTSPSSPSSPSTTSAPSSSASENKKEEQQEQRAYVYDLSAILIHKGISAYGGHYVAYIRDEKENKWWIFDDEHVQPLKTTILSSLDEEEDTTDASNNNNQKSKPSNPPKGMGGSCNAYMLIYSQRGKKIFPEPTAPESVTEKVNEDTTQFLHTVEEFEQTKAQELDRIAAHHELYAQIFGKIAVPENDTTSEFFWINTEWLSAWVTNNPPQLINNSVLLCEHNKVDPSKISLMKRISKSAWEYFSSQYTCDVTLSSNDEKYFPCKPCIMKICDKLQKQQEDVELKNHYIALLNADLSKSEEGYWIDKDWLKEWKKPNGKVPSNMTEDICCPHQKLSILSHKRKVISAEVWNYLHAYYPDSVALPSSMESCEVCLQQKEAEDSIRAEREILRKKEKAELECLYRYHGNTKSSSNVYHMIPTDWLNNWRAYIEDAALEDMPPRIDNSAFLCPHQLLKYDPSHQFNLIAKHSQQQQQSSSSTNNPPNEDIFTLIDEDSFKALSNRYKIEPVVRLLVSEDSQFSTEPAVCAECLSEQQRLDRERKLTYHNEHIFVTIAAKPSSSAAASSSASTTTTTDEQWSTVVASGRKKNKQFNNNPTTRTYATRSKDAAKEKTIKIEPIDSMQSLQTLKLQIYQHTDIAPFQQNLLLDDKPLDNDELTLAECSIMPRITLRLEKRDENAAYLDDFVPRSNDYEEGFKGTDLYSVHSPRHTDDPMQVESQEAPLAQMETEEEGWACSSCTYLNKKHLSKCEICESNDNLSDSISTEKTRPNKKLKSM